MSSRQSEAARISRRLFMMECTAATMIGSSPLLKAWGNENKLHPVYRGPFHQTFSLNQDWIFLGKMAENANISDLAKDSQHRITLPECVTSLSWENWDPDTWQHIWAYRRRFVVPKHSKESRLFLHFDRVMAGTEATLNGHVLPKHLGGFLPFQYEVTQMVQHGENDLLLKVDSRWLDAPPSGSPKGPGSIDYLLPGGINGSVDLRILPRIFVRNVFARPRNVLDANRQLDVICQLDAAIPFPADIRLQVSLLKNGNKLASSSTSDCLEKADQEFTLTLDRLDTIQLWDVTQPELYDLEVTLFVDRKPMHRYTTRMGFRDARFEENGFFLNGKRLQLFGLNRHELYPYFGYAASNRTMRRDAEILRNRFNCNMVRCSHYPQSEAFMDACDELGLLVWEETPGFQYIGGAAWQDLVLRDVREMVIRDRNHPSVIVWGVRLNESQNNPELYGKTRKIALELDGTRQTSGTMTPASERGWEKQWHQDVFAFDDYHATSPGVVGIRKPLPGVPYFVSEAVGQFNYPAGKGFNLTYRRNADPVAQQDQALFHAAAHDRAAGYPNCSGLLGWCAFDYPSIIHAYDGLKYPGIADFFRIPKLGAAFYESQISPQIRPVIAPDFYWDFGEHQPTGPGERAAIFSNCEQLEIFINGKLHSVLHPNREEFPHTAYPPFFANLKLDGTSKPELEIRGYLNERIILSRCFSSNPAQDKLWFEADDPELIGNGSDSTRLAFGIVDQYGSPRPFAGGMLQISVHGPARILGDNPFDLSLTGGMGAVWIRTLPETHGRIHLRAQHSTLPLQSEIEVRVI